MLAHAVAKIIARQMLVRHERESQAIATALEQFTDPQKKQFETRFEKHRKPLNIAYVCCCIAGAHYFYLGQPLRQLIFWGTCGGLIAWWLFDLTLLYFIVDSHNRKLALRIIDQIQRMPRTPTAVKPAVVPEAIAPTPPVAATPKPAATESRPKSLFAASAEVAKPVKSATNR